MQSKILFLFFSILCLYSNCTEEITFNVEKVETKVTSCSKVAGYYAFYIDGTFSSSASVLDKIYIDLVSPENAQAECVPYSSLNYWQCEIDICINPLDSATIILSVNAPTDNKYKFLNWEEVIGKTPGTSNKVAENVSCAPTSENNYTPYSIVSEGCSGTKNVFVIKGEYEDQTKLPECILDFRIIIDNEKKDMAYCESLLNKKDFRCKFEGEGDIKFEEKMFKGCSGVYTMKKADVSLHVDKCSGEDGGNSSSFLSMNMMMILEIFLILIL